MASKSPAQKLADAVASGGYSLLEKAEAEESASLAVVVDRIAGLESALRRVMALSERALEQYEGACRDTVRSIRRTAREALEG